MFRDTAYSPKKVKNIKRSYQKLGITNKKDKVQPGNLVKKMKKKFAYA